MLWAKLSILYLFRAKSDVFGPDWNLGQLGLALGQAEVTPLEMGAFVAMLANGGTQVYGQPVTHAIDQNGENHIYITGLGGRILDEDTVVRESLEYVENNGIVFVDEFDKI